MKTQEYNPQDEQIIQMLTPNIEVKPSADLKQRILKAAAEQSKAAEQTAKPRKNRFSYWLGAATSMAAVVAIAITFMLNTPAYAARRYFTNAILAANEVKTMIFKGKVRTKADEPIDYINPECDFVPATIKVIYDEPMLWSIEKEDGRTIFYKGADERGNNVYQWVQGFDSGWYASHAGYVGDELEVFLNPSLLLEAEKKAAAWQRGSRYEIIDNGVSVEVKVTTMAQGDYSESANMLNTSLAEANTVRMYTFDKASGRLTKLRIDMEISSELQKTVIESESIAYNEPLTAAELVDSDYSNVSFQSVNYQQTGSSPLAGITANKAAKIILSAMSSWDTTILDTALYFFNGDVRDVVKRKYEGLQIVSIGKPTKSGLYPGRFVKCKIILADGTEETLNLALRNDNSAEVWLLDGGI